MLCDTAHYFIYIVLWLTLKDVIIHIYFFFAANLPAASQFVVSSFSYHYSCYTSVQTARCCFTYWFINAGPYVPYSGGISRCTLLYAALAYAYSATSGL